MNDGVRRVTFFGIYLFALVILVGCDDKTDPEGGFDDGKRQTETSEIRIVKGSNGPAFENVSFSIATPGADQVVTGDSIPVTVKITGVELKAPTEGEGANNLAYSKDGQHIHVIVDNEPYMAMYDTTFMIGGLAPGAHTLRAFPSRSWHESVKNPGAFVAHTFYVGQKSGEAPLKQDQPLLTYSRPKGEYVGKDGEKVMIDFYLSNAELGPNGHKVIASIDDKVVDTLTEWVPYYIEGLQPGDHTIHLTLIDPDGKPVANGPFNDTKRTITIKEEQKNDTTKAEKGEEDEMEKEMYEVGRHSTGR